VDPLHGQHRFHAGLDLRAAYGQDVRAATEGVVTFAGEQAGYGLVVVVSHGSGLETRYAHLSSAEVAQGERVRAGDVIARSGNSGRTTGPHLHFEVRHHGQPVDPGRVAGLGPVVGRPDQTSAS
jgi:murein DD-endopeptidase MepM/ murein hydrolase activator NlpD